MNPATALPGIIQTITGPLVMIGFGSIGKGFLPLLERHVDFDRDRMVVIDPNDKDREILDSRNVRFMHLAITKQNYREVLSSLLTQGSGQGFCINLSVETSSLDIMRLCQEMGALYIDTVVEPWPGFYFDENLPLHQRTNYWFRETIQNEKRHAAHGSSTAISCCGANPGMVSWFVKQAISKIAADLGVFEISQTTTNREDWAKLAERIGLKGIHIAERDTQRSGHARSMSTFVNTWSIDGFISEALQPAELGWGTSETWFPPNGFRHTEGCLAAIYLNQPGGNTRVRSWCPTPGAQYGYLVPHDEAISIADYLTLGDKANPSYRPTCHYAYHPCDDAILSLDEMFGAGGLPVTFAPNTESSKIYSQHILSEADIIGGIDELGVLLYGHKKNAYWYGSRLSIETTRSIAPYQNATGLQVSSAILAGVIWALENPNKGIVDANDMDYRRCLEIQIPYISPVEGFYTDWTPLTGRSRLFAEDIDLDNPWSFKNILVKS